MSDQSPWGTPPPSSPYGSSTPQPPYQPPYQPPNQPPGGWAPPSYGPGGPSGRPPRRTGLIIGIVAAVLLVVAAFTVTLLVAGGDDEPNQADPSGSDTPTSEGPSSDGPSSDTPSTPGIDTPSTDSGAEGPSEDPATGATITGDGYTFNLPGPAWTDTIDEAGALGAGDTIDAFVVLGSSVQLAQSNVIVEAIAATGATSPEDIEAAWKRNLSSDDGATTNDIDDLDLDGERAIGVRIPDRTNDNGFEITQVAYLVLHGGNQYSIGLTFPRKGDDVSEADFQAMLASWTWTS